MKKYILFLVGFFTIVLESCGNGSTTNVTNDSTMVNLNAVSATDSTTAQIPTDSIGRK